MGERAVKTVRKNVEGRGREHTYPVRLNQREGWRWEGGRDGGGWVGVGQKRQDEEREGKPDQTRAAREGFKSLRYPKHN